MNLIRITMSLFVVVLIAVSLAGWIWTGANQPPSQSMAARTVLGIGMLAGVAGLAAIWRVKRG